MVALALLLRLLKTRLQIGNGLQILADGDEAQFLAQAHRRIFEGQFAATWQALIHLKTGGRALEAHILDHLQNLRIDLRIDRVGPGAPLPGVDSIIRKRVGRHGAANDALCIERQCDVRHCEAAGDHGWSRRGCAH